MAFQSKGPEPMWRPVYELLVKLVERNSHEVVTFAEFLAQTGVDVKVKKFALRRAADELLDTHSRTVESVRGVGYKIDANRLGMAKAHQAKGLTQFEISADLATRFDRNAYTDEQADALDAFGHQQSLINAMLARELRKQARRVVAVEQRQEAFENKMEQRLNGMMKQLGLPAAAPQLQGEIVEE